MDVSFRKSKREELILFRLRIGHSRIFFLCILYLQAGNCNRVMRLAVRLDTEEEIGGAEVSKNVLDGWKEVCWRGLF